jgi:tetratricopeptide (TPR) repeat protein
MRAAAAIDKNDLEQAIADFTAAIRLNADDAAAYYARGLAFSTNGDRARAVADLTEAVRITPYVPERVAALQQLKPDYKPPSLREFLGK